MKSSRYLLPFLLISFAACGSQEEVSDAYGNFEAIEVMVSAESQGRIVAFKPEEGSSLKENQVTVLIDTTQLYLKKIQLESLRTSTSSYHKRDS